MRNFFRKLFASEQADLLSLQSEIQRLRLELGEARAFSKQLEDQLERQRATEDSRRIAALEKILLDLSDPAAQFMLQLDLSGRQEKPLQTSDTLSVARNLLKILASYGLETAEAAGDTHLFDPEKHLALGGGSSIQPGQRVLIRVPGFSFLGRRLRKAGVSPLEN